MRDFNLFGNLLSPFNGIAVMGIISIWATTHFKNDDFRFYLLIFAGFCVIAAAVGDILHHKFRNTYEKEKEVAIKQADKS